MKWRRILDGEEVSSFVWARFGGVRNNVVIRVTVGSEELPRSLEGEEVADFGRGRRRKMRKCGMEM